MKKFWVLLVGIIFLASTSYAFDPGDYSISSDEQTADASIVTGRSYLQGIMVVTDGTNAVTVSTYDNTAGSGVELHPTWVVTTSATDRVQFLPLPYPVHATNGIYVDITCAGTVAYVVYYRER